MEELQPAYCLLNGGTTKRLSLSSLILTSAICVAPALAANYARVKVPFDFTAMGQSYPAGDYDLVLDNSRDYITMESRVDLAKQLRWIVSPADPAYKPAVVTFDVVGLDHELKNIQLDNKITPDLDKHRKQGISATTSIGGQ